jgi:hypothetical protein
MPRWGELLIDIVVGIVVVTMLCVWGWGLYFLLQ